MFKGQPKGLYFLALANTGERFGYYTMLAIFALFLQAKFGFSSVMTSQIYAGFMACVYFLPIIGGMLADRRGYGKMVTWGIVVMFLGYLALALPAPQNGVGIAAMVGALFLIALGTGLFKGNLQVLVGNLYDAPEYAERRDAAFSIFYMAINIGSMFAPTAATKITEYFMSKANLTYVSQIPQWANQFLDGSIKPEALAQYKELAQAQGAWNGDLAQFSQYYIDNLSGAYHWGFAVACISLIFSIFVYIIGRPYFKHADVNSKQQATAGNTSSVKVEELSPTETRQRITALCLVFAVVIFFWMAFQQSGLTLTFFARDYTQLSGLTGFTRFGFSILNLVLVVIGVYGLFAIFQSAKTSSRCLATIVTLVSFFGAYYLYNGMEPSIDVLPQTFQQFNPFFVVALTPVSLAVFGALARKGKEPSAPRKIGIGMIIAALGYLVMVFASIGMPTPNQLAETGIAADQLASPEWLISTYLVLTLAELFLSPMGISFVSKVAPPKYKGMMMGLWFAATAIGNYLMSIIGSLWGPLPLWVLWSILIAVCSLAAIFIFSMMKRLEAVAK
ncbi:MAG: peptide MFS transporter [Paludibacteraceae bacterium]|nr:peptide MFS transporter [Paludibacteraceae bacterium]